MNGPARSKMLSNSKADRCVAVMAALMAPGEQLLALADVTSVTPQSIGLAVTDRRLVAVPKTPKHPIELQAHRGQLRGVRLDKRLVFTYLIGITDTDEIEFGIALQEDRNFLQPFLDQFLAASSAGQAPREPIDGRVNPELARDSYRDPREPTAQASSGISLVKNSPQQASATDDKSTIADELVKLADLHQRGLLTDEEFQTAKAAVINGR
ncbi:hypothetical protein GOARA_091_00120 [Gordonia araii NBRC 100433]|uniref:SHOCT domain-containing protein n=1 Tax=Gordonia araii NBRC 100433 TaxID=1073574 RepID=G7H7R9_9ACTN|nr:SHOCT domain-containing protein [Gordonia araii]GAB11894.1 hypothetical protein GOARA_091_00120 [Gordonia araii NBRC 100433]